MKSKRPFKNIATMQEQDVFIAFSRETEVSRNL